VALLTQRGGRLKMLDLNNEIVVAQNRRSNFYNIKNK